MTREKLGEYTVVREIGRGGMGIVYEGRSPAGERVAIKTMRMPPDLDSRARWEMIERFIQEARALRGLQHRNIVSVLDTGESQGEFYIVMEYLDGESVRDLIDRDGPLSPPRALAILRDVCAALECAHSHGIVHRDIKPDNIVLLRNGITKLTDFGLARVGDFGTHTQVGMMVGTFAYMSPEQARGEKLDARSDLFSLGITLYEMLSGRRPFGGEATAAVLQAILLEEPEPIPNLPPELSLVLRRCLAKSPEQRFQSVRELLQVLEPPQEGTVVGRPVLLTGPVAPERPASAPEAQTGRMPRPGISQPSPAGGAPQGPRTPAGPPEPAWPGSPPPRRPESRQPGASPGAGIRASGSGSRWDALQDEDSLPRSQPARTPSAPVRSAYGYPAARPIPVEAPSSSHWLVRLLRWTAAVALAIIGLSFLVPKETAKRPAPERKAQPARKKAPPARTRPARQRSGIFRALTLPHIASSLSPPTGTHPGHSGGRAATRGEPSSADDATRRRGSC